MIGLLTLLDDISNVDKIEKLREPSKISKILNDNLALLS